MQFESITAPKINGPGKKLIPRRITNCVPRANARWLSGTDLCL